MFCHGVPARMLAHVLGATPVAPENKTNLGRAKPKYLPDNTSLGPPKITENLIKYANIMHLRGC